MNLGTFLDPCWREKRNSAEQKEKKDVGLRRREERPWRLVRKEENQTTSEEQRTRVSYLCEYSLTFQKWSYKEFTGDDSERTVEPLLDDLELRQIAKNADHCSVTISEGFRILDTVSYI